MDLTGISIVLIASIIAGIVNSVAGSGNLVVYPTLVYLGLSPHQAIATNIASVWMGLLTGLISYRSYFYITRNILLYFIVPSFVGACIGAYLLLNTPTEKLKLIVPYLIIFSVIVIAFSNFFENLYSKAVKNYILKVIIVISVQFLTGVYGSYFGAGIGLILLANILFFGISNFHNANFLKILLGLLINFTAFSVYIFSENIVWFYIPYLAVGYLVGGYLGGYVAQRFKVFYVKIFIIVWGIFVAISYIARWRMPS